MPTAPEIIKCYKYVDANKKKYVEELRKIVEIPSVSSNSKADKQILALIHWLESRLKKLGFTVSLNDIGNYVPIGQTGEVKLPFLLLGALGNDSSKKTLLYYCHLDVQKAEREKWSTNPFELIEKNGKLYGRGSSKMKGPLLCFIHAIECYKELGIDVPINIKIFCESMNECDSQRVPESLHSLKKSFLTNIDCILLNEGNWLGKNYPCIMYGFRGVCYFDITIDGPLEDFNSGDYGGMIYEPMEDLIFIINNLVDKSGHILVPNFYANVMPVTPEEEDIYHKIKINFEEYKKNSGITNFTHDEKVTRSLMHIWRYPSFNLHYIDSSNKCDHNVKLAIPKKVSARFSICIVPYQTHEQVSVLVTEYIKRIFHSRNTPNNVNVKVHDSADPWSEDYSHWNYKAAKIAAKQVFKDEANLIREGQGFPIILHLRKAFPKKNILVLPIANDDANIHSENENISLKNYIEGTKMIANYFYQLSQVSE